MTNRELICKLFQIRARCNKDLKDAVRSPKIVSPRDSYNQIKAFHYDAIDSLLTEWQESDNERSTKEC